MLTLMHTEDSVIQSWYHGHMLLLRFIKLWSTISILYVDMTYIFIDELKSAEEVEKDLNKKQHNHDTAAQWQQCSHWSIETMSQILEEQSCCSQLSPALVASMIHC